MRIKILALSLIISSSPSFAFFDVMSKFVNSVKTSSSNVDAKEELEHISTIKGYKSFLRNHPDNGHNQKIRNKAIRSMNVLIRKANADYRVKRYHTLQHRPSLISSLTDAKIYFKASNSQLDLVKIPFDGDNKSYAWSGRLKNKIGSYYIVETIAYHGNQSKHAKFAFKPSKRFKTLRLNDRVDVVGKFSEVKTFSTVINMRVKIPTLTKAYIF